MPELIRRAHSTLQHLHCFMTFRNRGISSSMAHNKSADGIDFLALIFYDHL
uniref:Uncharacterized protein n=1 Tax=Rhizophora mucronata TaxID=61149 RepID=A0A2P2IJD8_RHIMU